MMYLIVLLLNMVKQSNMSGRIKIFVVVLFVFLHGCIKEEDDLDGQNCELGCTMVTGKILTENGQVPLANLKLDVVWSKGGYGFGSIRTKATSKTDLNGNFSLKFEIQDEELKEGGFGITYALDKDKYLDSNRGIPLYGVKKDTMLMVNYNIPRKAFLDISVLNTDKIEQGATFYTDLYYMTPSGLEQPVDGHILPWSNESDNYRELEVPGNQPIVLTESRQKGDERIQKIDTIVIEAGTTKKITIDYVD